MKTSQKLLGLSMMVLTGAGCSVVSPLLGGTEPRAGAARATSTERPAPKDSPESSTGQGPSATGTPRETKAEGTTAKDPPKAEATAKDTASTQPAPPPKAPAVTTQPVSLREFALPIAINLPADATVTASTSKDKLGGANIDAKGLNLRVMRPDARLASTSAAKATLQKLAFRKASRFVTEEANLLVFERGEPAPLHFMLWVRQAGATYVCQGEAESAEALPAVLDVCKSIAPAK